MAKISVVVACNNDDILQSSLLASPDLRSDVQVIIERKHKSASRAYNAGLSVATGDLVVFVHQDVFLPPGWCRRLREAARQLDQIDPQWAVLGAFGVDSGGRGYGHLYSTGLRRVVGAPLSAPVKVETLDEVVLVLRCSAGLKFDDSFPGFHLYGADICMEAHRRGFSSYAFDAFCVHNTNGIPLLPWAYWKIWLHVRKKWRLALPIQTPCMPVSKWGTVAIRYLIRRPVSLFLRKVNLGNRIADPVALWRELEAKNPAATAIKSLP